ncbi:MAG TPA: hypothetical protein VGI39_43670 [Polyangiaceae bacterium]|jgi:hypothetical protein
MRFSWMSLGSSAGLVTVTGVVWASLAAVGCGSSGGDTGGGDDSGAPIVVTQATFNGFHDWTSFDFMGTPIPGSPHLTAGPRTDYIKALPPPGSTKFPVGTIIVKEVDDGATAARQVFAMVKVGGGYNSGGAVDWKWFELKNAADGTETILWGGTAPPAGEQYANTGITCNDCHSMASANDFVQSHVLNLATLGTPSGNDAGSSVADAGAE